MTPMPAASVLAALTRHILTLAIPALAIPALAALGGCGDRNEPAADALAQPALATPPAAGWSAAADTPAPPPVAAAVPAPATAPPLPYAYLGRWTVDGRTTVLIRRNGDNSTLTVTGRGPLDAQYAVQAVEPDRLLLTYLPLGLTTSLAFDPPPSSATPSARGQAVAAARPAPPPADSEQETN